MRVRVLKRAAAAQGTGAVRRADTLTRGLRQSTAGRAIAVGVSGLLLAACGATASAQGLPKPVQEFGPGPSAALAAAFPHSWSMYGSGPQHNAAFPGGFVAGLQRGYQWKFPEIHAVPLNQLPPGTAVVGQLRASVRVTQTVGNALGVSAVNGVIYAESDSGMVYALNAATGHQLWSQSFMNSAMGNPVIKHGRLFLGVGNTNFSFRELLQYKAGQPIMRGTGESGVYALDAATGKVLWNYPTASEDMPTPAYLHGSLFEANGNGNVFALNAATGALEWKTAMGGFNSMSSPVAWTNPVTHQGEVVTSFSNPDRLVGLSAATGAVLWTQTVPGSFDTGMSDAVAAVSPSHNVVLINTVVDPQTVNGQMTVNLAMEAVNATTGAVEWLTKFGRGPMPPAFKAGVPMIHGNFAYMNAPATDTMHAINLTTGQITWSYKSGFPGRAAPTYDNGVVYFTDGPDLFALNAKTGALLSKRTVGGLFGIVNPVIVGGTVYLDNSYNWIMAVPLHPSPTA